MDRNIAALVRQDVVTVHVRFGTGGNFELAMTGLAECETIDTGGVAIVDNPYITEKQIYARRVLDHGQVKEKSYKYVTDLKLAVGDFVVVYADNKLCVVQVCVVNTDCNIRPNDDKEYKWVVAKVDMVAYAENMKRNSKIEELVSKSYKSRIRHQYADLAMASLEQKDKDELMALMGTVEGQK